VVVNGTRDVVGLGNVGSGVVTVFTTDVVVAFAIVVVNGTRDVVGLGNVGSGVVTVFTNVVPGALGSGVVTVFGAVVAGKVVKLRAAFF